MIAYMHEPAPQLAASDQRRKHCALFLRVALRFLSSLRYPAHSTQITSNVAMRGIGALKWI